MKGIILFVLSVIILSQSYGFAHAVHISGHVGLDDSVVEPITVVTDSTSYETGEIISVSGSVSDYDESDPFKNFDVTLRVIASNNNIISISQIPLDSDGSYFTSILADGPLWKFDGDYTISVSHGSDTSTSTTFTFVVSTTVAEAEAAEAEAAEAAEAAEVAEAEAAEAAAAEKCGEGTHLDDGVCVLDETGESSPVSTGSSPSTGFNAWIYSISFTILIAFAIMIILYLISRASRNKNDN
jgi:hypothetical protein